MCWAITKAVKGAPKKAKNLVVSEREEPRNLEWFRILQGKEKQLVKHKLVKPRVHIVKADIAFDSKHKAYVIYLLEVTDEDGKLRWLVGKHLHINIFENTCKILPNEK